MTATSTNQSIFLETSIQIPEFIHSHQAQLQEIASYLASQPKSIKQQNRVEQNLKKVMSEPREILGQATCWPLGDIIIALQVPSGTKLWTLDADFEPLAEVLGFELYSLEMSDL